MNIILKNANGSSLSVDSRSDAACLVQAPDFGEAACSFKTAQMQGLHGEMLLSAHISPRDVTIKFEARNISSREIARVVSPLSEITGTINGHWKFKGIAKGTAKVEKNHEIMPAVYTVQIRMFDPCFYHVNGIKTVPFFNNGGSLYDHGYNYQKLTILNEGDVPIPVYINMEALTPSGASGLFSHADWNDGVPEYIGYRFATTRDVGKVFYVSSDINDPHALDCYGHFRTFNPIILEPGLNTLYALNSKGTVKFEPRFLNMGDEL